MAVVRLKPGQALTASDLIAHGRRPVGNLQDSTAIEFWNTELPKSGSDKILKRTLRDQHPRRQARA